MKICVLMTVIVSYALLVTLAQSVLRPPIVQHGITGLRRTQWNARSNHSVLNTRPRFITPSNLIPILMSKRSARRATRSSARTRRHSYTLLRAVLVWVWGLVRGHPAMWWPKLTQTQTNKKEFNFNSNQFQNVQKKNSNFYIFIYIIIKSIYKNK